MMLRHYIRHKREWFIGLLCFMLYIRVFGQHHQEQYALAKKLFVKKQYGRAVKAFEPLIVYNPSNPYFRYASFYYAVAMVENGQLMPAKTILLQLRKLYPAWKQLSELNYWLAKIYFQQRQHFQAMNMLKKCIGKGMQNSIDLTKKHYLEKIKDVEILYMLLEEHPNDRIVAQILVNAISHSPSFGLYDQLSDSLYNRFNLTHDTTALFPKEKTIFKENYTIALLFPFMVDKLYPTLTQKVNQNILDLYKGISMARDTLEQQQVHINLKLYDTQRAPAVTAAILHDEGIKTSDLLVGPLFSSQLNQVKKFSKKHNINMITPISGNSLHLEDNPYSILYMPSHKTIGIRSAEWLDTHTPNKMCLVIFDDQLKSLTTLNGFLQRAEQLGLQVEQKKCVSVQQADQIFYELTSFSPSVDSKDLQNVDITQQNERGSIFVISDNPMIYTKVISAVEINNTPITILGHQNWINNKVVSFEAYERLNIVMAAPGFYSLDSPEYQKVKRQYVTKYGEILSYYAATGYEFMLFIGQCLNQYGVYFQKALSEQGFVKGHLSEGYNFRQSRSNQFVPFIHFEHGKLTLFP